MDYVYRKPLAYKSRLLHSSTRYKRTEGGRSDVPSDGSSQIPKKDGLYSIHIHLGHKENRYLDKVNRKDVGDSLMSPDDSFHVTGQRSEIDRKILKSAKNGIVTKMWLSVAD